MKKLQIVIVAVALVIAVQARASIVFDLSYSDPSGNTLLGEITASSIAPDEYLASSASLILTSPAYSAFNGSYSLAGGFGAFSTDNILYYPGQPIVDFSGALVLESSSGTYINLFSASPSGGSVSIPGPADYALLGYNGGYINFYPSDASSNVGGPAIATLTPVPESTTVIAGALLLLPFGASALRILRRNRMA